MGGLGVGVGDGVGLGVGDGVGVGGVGVGVAGFGVGVAGVGVGVAGVGVGDGVGVGVAGVGVGVAGFGVGVIVGTGVADGEGLTAGVGVAGIAVGAGVGDSFPITACGGASLLDSDSLNLTGPHPVPKAKVIRAISVGNRKVAIEIISFSLCHLHKATQRPDEIAFKWRRGANSV